MREKKNLMVTSFSENRMGGSHRDDKAQSKYKPCMLYGF